MSVVLKLADPGDDASRAELVAKVALSSGTSAGAVVCDYSRWMGKPDMLALAAVLDDWSGDMKEPEAMLYSQAHALQAMFANLARTAHAQPDHPNWESLMRMALKAQGQCRTTIETLATLKNPPVIFAKQANINNGGQQQVNNGYMAAARAHAANSELVQTEQLEIGDGERLDTRATSAASSTYPNLETVGAIDRAENEGWQSAIVEERDGSSRRPVARVTRDGEAPQRGVSKAPRQARRARGDVVRAAPNNF